MQFKFDNVFNTLPLTLVVEYKGQRIEFIVKSVLFKNKRDDLVSDDQFRLLEAYLSYKGEEFQDHLWNKYIEFNNKAISAFLNGTEDIKQIIIDVFNMFDINDIVYFLRDIYGVKAPSNLKETFDENIIKDKIGTRIQTYTIQEYYELASLSIVSKATIGLIGNYASLTADDYENNIKEYLILSSLMSGANKIFNSPPVIKLIGMLSKILFPDKAEDNNINNVLDKLVPKDELPIWLFSRLFLRRLSIETVINDNEKINIITSMYNDGSNIVKSPTNVSNNYIIKQPPTTSDEEESESILESYRLTTELSLGSIEEIRWVFNDINELIDIYDLQEYKKDIGVLRDVFRANTNRIIPKQIIAISAMCMYKVIDPRAISYVQQDQLVNILTISFFHMWKNGFKDIALLSTIQEIKNEDYMLSGAINILRLTSKIQEELNNVYPITRIKQNKKGEHAIKNPVIETIDEIVNLLVSKNFMYLAPAKYTDGKAIVEIDKNIKNRLAEFFITIINKEI